MNKNPILENPIMIRRNLHAIYLSDFLVANSRGCWISTANLFLRWVKEGSLLVAWDAYIYDDRGPLFSHRLNLLIFLAIATEYVQKPERVVCGM